MTPLDGIGEITTPLGRYVALLLRLRQARPVQPLPVSDGQSSRRLTSAQKLALVEQWRNSGMSAREFADRAGVLPMTFGNWTRGLYLGNGGRPRRC